MTPWEAQAIHAKRRLEDPGHDIIECWCCCTDCDFELDSETGQVTPGPDAS